MISVGTVGEKKIWVTNIELASALGSGSLPVFATPAMVLLIESTAYESVLPELGEGESTVGISLNIKHTAPSVEGSEITCRTELIEVDRSRLVFRAEVSDGSGPIGTGTHERFLVKSEAFMSKARERRE
ncbi:MAG: thioesterase family protein [Candidatus Methanoplasma sp.]|jgi:predicted thioesterase|nr:thioesterase family protein [Candidatus Methanoplasma sp.]